MLVLCKASPRRTHQCPDTLCHWRRAWQNVSGNMEKKVGSPLTCNPMDKNIGSCLVCSHNSRHTFSFKVVKFSSISKLIYICHIWDISQHTYRPKVTNWNNIVFTKKILFKEKNLTLGQNHLPASWHSSMSVQLLLSDSNLRWFWFWIVYCLSLLLIYWIVYWTKSPNGLSWQCLCSLLTKKYLQNPQP